MSSFVTFEIELPEQVAATSFGQFKPKAKLVLTSDNFSRTHYIPQRVAKKLIHKSEQLNRQFTVMDDAEAFIDKTLDEEAWLRVVKLFERRDYSASEVSFKLKQDGFKEPYIAQAIDKAKEIGLLSDLRFADAFITSKVSCGWGRFRIEKELLKRGVDLESIPGWPSDYFSEASDFERASELIQRKSVPEKNGYQKLVRFLVARGYSISVAKAAVTQKLNQFKDD